jgi:hypothetical protein
MRWRGKSETDLVVVVVGCLCRGGDERTDPAVPGRVRDVARRTRLERSRAAVVGLGLFGPVS